MKKIFMFLMVIMLTACGARVDSDENNYEPSIIDFGYIHFFLEEGNETYHYNFFSNGSLNTHSFSYGNNESSKTTRINFKDYGVTSFIGGDSIRLTYSGEIWTTMPYPAGDSSIFGELYNVEYFPSEIYEVTLDKEVIEGDNIHIGFNTDFVDFDLENYYVISLDEKKDISEYEDGYTFYYSFNTLMENPHKYSFLYDYKVR